MNKKQVAAFLECEEWTFAKTMPTTPHWYIIKQKCSDPDKFVEAAEYLQANGVPHRFFKKVYLYSFFGKYKYWTNGYPIDQTDVINRAEI